MEYTMREMIDENQTTSLVIDVQVPTYIEDPAEIEVLIDKITNNLTLKCEQASTVVPMRGFQFSETLISAKFRKKKSLLSIKIPLLCSEQRHESSTEITDTARPQNSGDFLNDGSAKHHQNSKGRRDSDSRSKMEKAVRLPELTHMLMSTLPFRLEIRPRPTGRCVVANEAITSGQLILFEEPLAFLRSNESDCSAPPSAESSEWQLTRVLLRDHGCNQAWASCYAGDPLPHDTTDTDADAISWCLRSCRGRDVHNGHSGLGTGGGGCGGGGGLAACAGPGGAATAEDVVAVRRAVANNAFALASSVLQIPYGTAFYRCAALLNHSCEPNCFSLRLIDPGEELTHSYISSRLLLGSEEARRKHLFFRWIPSVWQRKNPPPVTAACRPPTPAEERVGHQCAKLFIAGVSRDSEAVLEEGDHLLESLGPRPAAFAFGPIAWRLMDALDAYLQAHWEVLANAHIHCSVCSYRDAAVHDALGGWSHDQDTRKRGGQKAAAAGRLWLDVIEAAAADRQVPRVVGERAIAAAEIVCTVLTGEDVDRCRGALSRMTCWYGGGLRFLQEDLACIQAMASANKGRLPLGAAKFLGLAAGGGGGVGLT